MLSLSRIEDLGGDDRHGSIVLFTAVFASRRLLLVSEAAIEKTLMRFASFKGEQT